MEEITSDYTDALVRSLLNYYLLVRCGVLRDNFVTEDFLKAIREIEKQGPALFQEPI